jgi:3D-(3,5/4)-trihydroxycyclohexane-1,2-dione acylhydrolase (decyclizing)
LSELSARLGDWSAPAKWRQSAEKERNRWLAAADRATGPTNVTPPSDAQVIGAVQRRSSDATVVVCAAGGLPGELHKLWHAERPGGYHLEYGYSCMGYEIAGGIGVKLALPDRDIVVMVGDGSYLMLNSEIATSILLGQKLTIVVLDNHGFGCINRLQNATGNASFNNLFADTRHVDLPQIDFRAHAESLGAIAERAVTVDELESALDRARDNDRTTVVVIETDPLVTTEAGGHWWDVAVPEVSEQKKVVAARAAYERALAGRRLGD